MSVSKPEIRANAVRQRDPQAQSQMQMRQQKGALTKISLAKTTSTAAASSKIQTSDAPDQMGKTATVSHLQLNQSSEAKLVLPSKLSASNRDLSVPKVQAERASSRHSRRPKNLPITSLAQLNDESRKRRVEALQKFMRSGPLGVSISKPSKVINVTNNYQTNKEQKPAQRNIRSAAKGIRKADTSRQSSTQRSKKEAIHFVRHNEPRYAKNQDFSDYSWLEEQSLIVSSDRNSIGAMKDRQIIEQQRLNAYRKQANGLKLNYMGDLGDTDQKLHVLSPVSATNIEVGGQFSSIHNSQTAPLEQRQQEKTTNIEQSRSNSSTAHKNPVDSAQNPAKTVLKKQTESASLLKAKRKMQNEREQDIQRDQILTRRKLKEANVLLNQMQLKDTKIDYLTSMREERFNKITRAMKPFVYQDVVKQIKSKSKGAARGRSFLTHLSPGFVVQIDDKSSRNNKVKSSQTGSPAGSKSAASQVQQPQTTMNNIRKQQMKADKLRQECQTLMDQCLIYLIQLRSTSFICQTSRVNPAGLKIFKKFYVDHQGQTICDITQGDGSFFPNKQ